MATVSRKDVVALLERRQGELRQRVLVGRVDDGRVGDLVDHGVERRALARSQVRLVRPELDQQDRRFRRQLLPVRPRSRAVHAGHDQRRRDHQLERARAETHPPAAPIALALSTAGMIGSTI